MNSIGILGIPRHFHTSESAALRAAVYQVALSPKYQILKQRISDDDRFKALQGKQIARGDGGGGSVDEHHLLAWWVWRANEVGSETADIELEYFLSSEEIDSLVCVWLFGSFVQQKVELFDGIELWPIEDMPYSSEKSDFTKHFIGELGSIISAPRTALIKKVRRRKIIDTNITNMGTDLSAESVGHDLNALALVMNVLPNVYTSVCFTCSYYPDGIPPGVWNGGGRSGPISDTIIGQGTLFQNSENVDLKGLLKAYLQRSITERSKLRIALERLQSAKGRVRNPASTALDLGISLERLLLENTKGDQLSLSFRLRGAWLIGKNLEDRSYVHDTLKEIYEIRSSVAHSGMSKRLDSYAPYQTELASHFGVAERIARKVILDGSPDWKALLLGKSAG